MRIRALRLANFRNYETLDFQPSGGLNILTGPNAQGKSALLESIYLLATSKSHRTSHDSEMIKIGQSFARVCAEIERLARPDTEIEVILRQGEKKIVRVNSVKQERIADAVGQLNAVIFSAADSDMVRGEPAMRRRFLNLEISQISPGYVYNLARYKRVLEQRNNLLKAVRAGAASAEGLHLWNAQLVQYGAAVAAKRAQFLASASEVAAEIYQTLSGECETLKVSYRPGIGINAAGEEKDIMEAFAAALAARMESDIARGTTGVGPHRDDVAINIDGLPAREYGSQGQQRTAAAALKLAEIELVLEYAGEEPVVLLDDIMGELDETRRAQVLRFAAGRCQTFLATTDLSDVPAELLEQASVWSVRSGRVTPG